MTNLPVLQRAVLRIHKRFRIEPAPSPLDLPCRIWQGAVNSAGYGIVRVHLGPKRNKVITIQRLIYCFYTMEPIPDGLVVGHKCDRKLCGEFTHLEAISYGDNLRDAWARHRRARPHTLTLQSGLWRAEA